MKAVMTRIAWDMVMDKDTVSTREAFYRFADCYDLTGRLMTKPARGHAIYAIDLFKIRPAQPAGAHLNKNVTCATQVWYLDIIDRNCVVSFYKDCLHLLILDFYQI
jgi:hypothetical protein